MRFKSRLIRFALLAVVAGLLAPLTFVSARQQDRPKNPPYPDQAESIGETARGGDAVAKLAPELRMLQDQFSGRSRGGGPPAFSAAQLDQMFSIKPGEENPFVGVAVTVSTNTKIADLKKYGARVYWRMNDVVFADLRVRSLEDVAREAYVLSIAAAKAAALPPFPKAEKPPSIELPDRGGNRPGTPKLDTEFNARGLTGKGVIIGIVDSGIDWRHGDFIRPDGTSRILYLWDQLDESFDQSKARIGAKPPVLFEGGDPGPGTVYTNQQINAALKGGGKVNSIDYHGHGTACAGTAAGNGRATANGVAAGAFTGVAPEADLIIVKASDCGEIKPSSVLGTVWIAQMAKALKRPVVINHSFGRHFTSHTGDEFDEHVMNSLSGAGKPGVAITVAAGNEAQFSLHANDRFGPRRPGQADTEGTQFELYVSADRTKDITLLNGYFHREDEWGLAIKGMNGLLTDEKGEPCYFYIRKVNGRVQVLLPKRARKPAYFDAFAEGIIRNAELAEKEKRFDKLSIVLPPGTYYLLGFGATDKVSRGAFDLYLPLYQEGGFVIGAAKKQMVGSPGNAANAITVGAYDFRANWVNQKNSQTIFNLNLGNISDYSNPGGPRDGGIYKPELAAPATYTISSLSQATGSALSPCRGQNITAGLGANAITPDGLHIAWAGTSAAAPYTAGIIALMMQKNPQLDAAQIKSILVKTAIKGDKFVGAAPNPEWGYGKINPEAALAATPVKGQKQSRPLAR